MRTVIGILGLAVSFFFWGQAFPHGEELSEIDPEFAAYCSIYARESVFIEVMHGDQPIVADTDVILGMATEAYRQCLSILPRLLPLPAEQGSLKAWLADIRDILLLRAGTKPASEAPKPATEPSSAALSDDDWRAQCEAEYVSWDPDTETVVRNGSRERVRCPCGGEVDCS